MELARILRELSTRPRLLVLGLVVAALAATFSVYRLDGAKLKPRSLQYSAASTEVIVDSRASVIGNIAQPFEPLAQRAQVYANFMASPPLLAAIGQQVGLSGSQLYAAGPVNASAQRVEQEPTDLRRNIEITGETKPYKLNFESFGNVPTITINSQAPTTRQAIALADAAALSLQGYVERVESAGGIPQPARIVIRRLGPASGGVVDGGVSKTLAAIVFVAAFLFWCVLVLLGGRFREAWRESAAPDEAASRVVDSDDDFETPRRGLDSANGHDTGVLIEPPPAGDDKRSVPVPAQSGR